MEPSNESDLRAALQFAVIQACTDDDAAGSSTLSPAALASLSELTFLYARQCLAPDLEAFRDHAGRRTITESDVKLVARKHSVTAGKLDDFCEAQSAAVATSAAAAATSNPNKKKAGRKKAVDLQSMKDADGSETESDVSSSSEELRERLAAARHVPPKTTAPLDELMMEDSDSDCVLGDSVLDKKPAARSKKPVLDDSSSDDEDLLRPSKSTNQSAAKKRFRLGNVTNAKSGSDSSTEEEELFAVKKPKGSRVKEILATLSQESVGMSD